MRRNKNKYILLSLIGILLLMIVGYAGFNSSLKITETSEVTNNWDISITDIKTKSGTATNKTEPLYEGLTANFDVNFESIGDYIEYDVTVTNNGSVEAYLNTINVTDGNNEVVNMSYNGIDVGEKLGIGQSKTFTVKLLYKGGSGEGSSEITIGYGGTNEQGTPVVPINSPKVVYDYETNGGTGEIKEKYFVEGENVELNINGKKEGYTFVGWNTNKDAKTPILELIMPSEDITLYAIYKKELKATYKLGTGIYKIGKESDSCFIYNNESSCTLTLPNIEVKEGYEVDGWYDEEDNKKAIGDEIVLTNNVTYTAKSIDRISPTITLSPNSGNTYKTSRNIEVTISDEDSGLKANQKIYYGWSISNEDEPEYINYVTTNNEEGTKETTVTISSDENITGTYYLWIKEGTVLDLNENGNKKVISEGFKFDNTPPTLNVTTSKTTNSITVVADAEDDSGISKYEYSIDNGETWIDGGINNTYTFDGLFHNSEYHVKVRVTDGVGLQNDKTEILSTEYIALPIFSEEADIIDEEGNLKVTVTITYPEGCGDKFSCSYELKDGTEETVEDVVKVLIFTTSEGDNTIIAKVNDGTNYITSSTYTVVTEREHNYDAVGTETYVVSKDGYYKVELWGANGGIHSTNYGGKGAYTSGEIYLEKGDTLYFYNGEDGVDANNCLSDLVFNGGGMTLSNNNACGPSGGGATDARLISGDWNNANSLRSRIMVAAGGAAMADGGDLIGREGYTTDYAWYTSIGKKATQTSGGEVPTLDSACTTSNGTAGGFGYGGNGGASGPSVETSGGSGGGSGYYGGSGASGLCNGTYPGGSGSSYISGYAGVNSITSETNGTHTNGTNHYSGKYFINTEMQAGVNDSGGKSKITFIGTPSSEDSKKILGVRYIKDCINGNSYNVYNHWVEIEAINKGVNVAKGKSVTGTVTESNDTTWAYSNIVDGKIDNITGSSGFGYASETGNQCVTVDLGAEYDLEEIGVWHYYEDDRTYYENTTSIAGENGLYREIYNGEKAETPNGNHIKTDNLIPKFTGIQEHGKTTVTINYPGGCADTYNCSYIKNNGEEVIVTENSVNLEFLETGTITAKVMRESEYIASSSYTAIVILEYEYNYTSSHQAQTFTAPKDGYYKVETWGAQGGSAKYSTSYSGGLGAYTSGEIYLNQGDILYVYSGGMGSSHSGTATDSLSVNGSGFNGGSTGKFFANNSNAGGGGGATDIRVGGTSLNDRIMVAAGGGGGVSHGSAPSYSGTGGAGGTLLGQDAIQANTTCYSYGTGGKQTVSGSSVPCAVDGTTSYVDGAFGIGGADNHAGGGSGYYGGTSGSHAAGGGGSSYISGYAGVNSITSSSSLVHTNGTNHYSGKYFINTEMQAGVNSGNGKAKIIFIDKPTSEDSQKILGVRYIKDCTNGNSENDKNHWVELQAINKGINVAYGKNVSSTSDVITTTEPLTALVDGKMEDASEYVHLTSGNQCVSVDLGKEYDLEEIAVWHYYADSRTYYENTTSVAGEDGVYRTIYSGSKVEQVTGNRIKNNESSNMAGLTPTFSVSGGTTSKTVTITYPSGCGTALSCSYSKDGGSSVAVTSKTASVAFTNNGKITAKVTKGDESVSSGYIVTGITPVTLEISGYSSFGDFQVPTWCVSSGPWTKSQYTFNITATGSPVSSGSLCYYSYCRSYASSGSTGAGWACFNSASVWTYYRAGDWVTATVCNAAGTCKSVDVLGGS